jgi:hypothetical protein
LFEEAFHQGFEVRDIVGLLLGLVGRWGRRRGWRKRKSFRGDLSVGYSWLGVSGLLDEGGKSILFEAERGVGLPLQVLVDRTALVIGGVVAITENTADCT